MENIKKAKIEEINQTYKERLNKITTPEGLKEFLSFHGKKYKEHNQKEKTIRFITLEKDKALKEKLSKPIPQEEVDSVIEELRAHPALIGAREYLHDLARESKAMLTNLPNNPARKTLESLCDAIVDRTA